jgi:GntR family transcriptional regulator
VSFERIRSEEADAEPLGLRAGDPVLQIENRLLLQGRAVVHDRLVVPVLLVRGLTEKKLSERPGTIYQLYQSAFGITVVRAIERARAVACDRSVARVLGLSVGEPVLQVRRVALTFGDKPVELRISTIDTAQHDYVQMLSQPA